MIRALLLLLLASNAWASAWVPLARDLIVRWEVTSERTYVQRYQAPIWPGGASGVTWCIGYDGGHQPRRVILDDWVRHQHRERLAGTAGVTGEGALAILPQYLDILTPWPLCVDVFDQRVLPRYWVQTRQAYGRAIEIAPPGVQAALVSEVYNRGPGMAGDRRRERRVIRDVCLPAGDAECVAKQLESSCRVWAHDRTNGPGLCARRKDEATRARAGWGITR